MKNENPKISVIVPVYNTEKYLRRCIDSILNQTFADFEVLLINDGSTDSSGAICDEYAKQDSRIRVFHKENGGVSSARNVGLQNMKGEYSIHCDSDDWIDDRMYEILYKKAKDSDADIVWCDLLRIDANGNKTVFSQKGREVSTECINQLLVGNMHGSTCNKLIRNTLIYENKISFPRGINMWEDLYFSIQCLMYSSRIGYVNKPLYYYVSLENSLCTINSEGIIKNKYDVVKQIEQILGDNGMYSESLLILKVNVKSIFLVNKKFRSFSKWKSVFPEVNNLDAFFVLGWKRRILLLMLMFFPRGLINQVINKL